MNIQILNEFVCLAQYLNFTETAAHLFISQPVLSRHIAGLEEELNVQLFIRDKHNVQLTNVGEMFFHEAKILVEAYDAALNKIRIFAADMGVGLKIGYLDAAVRHFLPAFIRQFKQEHSNIELTLLSLHKGGPEGITHLLKNNYLDVGFDLRFDTMDTEESCLNSRKLWADSLSVVLRADHPLSDRREIRFSSLPNEPFIKFCEQVHPGSWRKIEKLSQKNNVSLTVSRETSSIDNALFLVAAGFGITILPSHFKVYSNPNICFIKLVDDDAFCDVIVSWNKTNAHPAIHVLIKALTQFISIRCLSNIEAPIT